MMTGGTPILGHHHILNEQRWDVQKHIGEFSLKKGL